jgi:hypothetical protein
VEFEIWIISNSNYAITPSCVPDEEPEVVTKLESGVELGLADEDWKRMSFQKTRIERSDQSLLTVGGVYEGLRAVGGGRRQ